MISKEGAPDARRPHTGGVCISVEAWGWNVKAPHSADDSQSNDQRSFLRPLGEHTNSYQLLVLGAEITSEWQFPFFPFFFV